jgi:hypothetical protein
MSVDKISIPKVPIGNQKQPIQQSGGGSFQSTIENRQFKRSERSRQDTENKDANFFHRHQSRQATENK